MTFDPTSFNPSDHASDRPMDLANLPPGNYVMVATGFNRRFMNGKHVLSFPCRPILKSTGETVDSSRFFAVWKNCFLTEAAIGFFADFCVAIGQSQPFNINSDNEVSGALCWIPFMAKVGLKTYNEKTSSEIKGYLPLNQSLRNQALEIIQDMIANQATGGNEYSGGQSNVDAWGEDLGDSDQQVPLDDEIPF